MKSAVRFITIIFCLIMARPAVGGGLLYVAHTRPDTIGVYSVSLLKMVESIPVGKEPLDIAASPDGRWLAVSHRQGSGPGPDMVWIIDRKKGAVAHKVDIYQTRYRETGDSYILFSRDGQKLYVVDSGTGFLDVVRTRDWRLTKKVRMGMHPMNPLLSRDGRRLYVPDLYSRKIIIVDTERDAVVDSLAIDGMPSAAALSPDGLTIYVSDMEGHRVLFMDLATRGITGRVSVGSRPRNILLAGGFLYVLNTQSNNMSIIDVEKGENIRAVGMGILPERMAYDPEGRRLYVVSRDAGINVVDAARQERLKNIAADITPAGMVFVP